VYGLGAEFVHGQDWTWNVVDLSLVVISVSEMLGSVFEEASMLRMMRVIRIFRVVRVVRLLKFFRPLRVLVSSIQATLKSLLSAVILLSLIMYIFAVVFTQSAADASGSGELDAHFGSLRRSVLTLLMSISNGISWQIVFEPLAERHWAYGICFVAYVTFCTFAVLNVMTGQFCQSAIETVKKDDEIMYSEHLANTEFYGRKLKTLFSSIVEDSEGGFTLETFEQHLQDDRVAAYFHSLDITTRDAWKLFRLLNRDGDKVIAMDEFIAGCLELKGPATVIDVKDLQQEFVLFTQRLDGQLEELAGLLRA